MEAAIEQSNGNGLAHSNLREEMSAKILEMVLAGGDLGKLTITERAEYVMEFCRVLGLNHLSRPIELVNMNGKVVPYATKDAAQQLRKIHDISIDPNPTVQVIEGVLCVTTVARTPEGRTDTDMGAVPIANLKGELLANAYLKCFTKSKRRVTLSICGLGMLDETEVDSVAGAKKLTDERQPTRKLETPIRSIISDEIIGTTTSLDHSASIEYVDSKEPHEMTMLEQIEVFARSLPTLPVDRMQQIAINLCGMINTREEKEALARCFEKQPDEIKEPIQAAYIIAADRIRKKGAK